MYAEIAYKLAIEAHKGQFDKGGNDYILHPCAVANMLDTDIEKAIAYLHDVVEDTDITLQDLRKKFPDVIIDAIDAITKRNNEDYDIYINRVARNDIAKKVKLADMTHNSDITRIKYPTSKDIDRCNKYNHKINELRVFKKSC